MQDYVANPVMVKAAVIEDTRNVAGFPEVLIDGAWQKLPEGADARYSPLQGDYYVVQEDGYVYVNPKAVFERKYRPLAPGGMTGQMPKELPATGIRTVERESQAQQVKPQAETADPKASSEASQTPSNKPSSSVSSAPTASTGSSARAADPGTQPIADAASAASEKGKSAR